MSGALRLRNEGSEHARTTPTKDGVSAWLDVLEPMLRVPAAQKRELRDELESHLRDRVNDLIVSGKDEASAVSAAIAELGDAAELAARYQRAHQGFFGRNAMHMLIGLAAGSAVLLGSLAVRPTTPPGTGTAFVASAPADPAELAALRLSVVHDTTWEAFFADVGARAKMPVVVSWHRLLALTNDGNFTPGDPVGRSFDQLNFAEALAFLNDSLNQGREDGIAYRVRDGRLFISSVEDFDEQEATLTTFSLTPLIESVRAAGIDPMGARQYVEERVMRLVTGMVSPELWEETGGTRARCRVFEGKLFVHAPARLQERIRWVLSEAESAAAEGARSAGMNGGGSWDRSGAEPARATLPRNDAPAPEARFSGAK